MGPLVERIVHDDPDSARLAGLELPPWQIVLVPDVAEDEFHPARGATPDDPDSGDQLTAVGDIHLFPEQIPDHAAPRGVVIDVAGLAQNPAGVDADDGQVHPRILVVGDPELTELTGQVAQRLGDRAAFLVGQHGHDRAVVQGGQAAGGEPAQRGHVGHQRGEQQVLATRSSARNACCGPRPPTCCSVSPCRSSR